jgi:hypothetical protein
MPNLTLKFEAQQYHCEPCSLKQGTLVTELVRMIPKPVIAFGKLIGDEYYCCPICFDPKFTVKGRKALKDGARIKKAKVAKDPGPGTAGPGRGSRLRVVKD